MNRAVSVALCLSSRSVQADTSPCEATDEQNPLTPTFCQPAEEKGAFGTRHWTMTAEHMCDLVGNFHCITLDEMHCDGTPSKCMKWGDDAYFGRVLLPQGVKLYGYGDWSCDGPYRFHTHGPTPHPEDHWDFDWRVDAFTLALDEGYTCSKHSSPAVQRIHPCRPHSVSGHWEYWFSQMSGNQMTQTLQVGMTSTETTNDQQSYAASMSEQVSGGMEVGGHVQLSSQQSMSISESVTAALQHSTVETESKTLTGAGTYWQFVVTATNTASCHAQDYQIWLADYVRTPNMASPPCCAPGLFQNIDEPLGDCIDGAPRLCDTTSDLLLLEDAPVLVVSEDVPVPVVSAPTKTAVPPGLPLLEDGESSKVVPSLLFVIAVCVVLCWCRPGALSFHEFWLAAKQFSGQAIAVEDAIRAEDADDHKPALEDFKATSHRVAHDEEAADHRRNGDSLSLHAPLLA